LHFRLPSEDEFEVDYIVTVAATLTMELIVTNTGAADFSFETCLHTYFQVGAVETIEVAGLQGVRYRDVLSGDDFTEAGATIRFTAETDRTYQDTAGTVEIRDPQLQRTILVRKSGSMSTVVWNPWIEKSIRMPDFGDDEYHHMVCVESGNVGEHAITLAPGERSSLKVEIDSLPQVWC
jgi:D-hexose-6-phosphate mutarotase